MSGAALLTLLLLQAPAYHPPMIADESASCARPGSRPVLCARVLDDRGVARVLVLFRAAGRKPYFAIEMLFDGARYCATLPAPLGGTRGIDYYLEAVDIDFEPSRVAAKVLPVSPGCTAPAAGNDPPPASVSPLQRRQKLEGFDPRSFTLAVPPAPAPER